MDKICITCGKKLIKRQLKYCSRYCTLTNSMNKKKQYKELKNLWESSEYRKRQSERTKKLWQQLEFRVKQFSTRINRFLSKKELIYDKISIFLLKYYKNLVNRKRHSDICKIVCNSPQALENYSKASKKRWNDVEYKKCQLSKILAKRSPNKIETIIKMKCEENKLPIKFIGNGSFWITSKSKHLNPDFKIDGQKKVIELFGNYWHKNDNPQDRINLYKFVGYNCLVIWENEIKKNLIEIIEKIKVFIKEV